MAWSEPWCLIVEGFGEVCEFQVVVAFEGFEGVVVLSLRRGWCSSLGFLLLAQ